MGTFAAMKLYLGCSNGEHAQHKKVLEENGPIEDWEISDKFTQGTAYGKTMVNYDALDIPYPDKSIEIIYNSHLLEHISHLEIEKILKHWHAKLKDGGKLILNVPDLEWICKWYLRVLNMERDGLSTFENNHYHWTHNWDLPGNSFIQMFYGSQTHEGEYHKVGFSDISLKEILTRAGFKNITVKKEFEAHDMGCLIAEAYA